jgi:hypothetical protein
MQRSHLFVCLGLYLILFSTSSCKKGVAADIVLDSYDRLMRNGVGIFCGQVWNRGDGKAENVSIYLEAKGSNDQLISSGLGNAATFMLPGDKAKFEIWLSLVTDWSMVKKIDYQILWIDYENGKTIEAKGSIIF